MNTSFTRSGERNVESGFAVQQNSGKICENVARNGFRLMVSSAPPMLIVLHVGPLGWPLAKVCANCARIKFSLQFFGLLLGIFLPLGFVWAQNDYRNKDFFALGFMSFFDEWPDINSFFWIFWLLAFWKGPTPPIPLPFCNVFLLLKIVYCF